MYLLVTNNFGIQIMQYLCFENLFIMQYPDQFVVQQADLMSPWQPLHGQARDDESQKWTVCLNQASDVHVRKLRPLMHELGLQLQVTLLNRTCRPGPVPSTTRVVLLVQYPVSHSKEKTHAHMHGMHMQWCGPRSPGSWYLCAGRPHTCSSAAPCFIGGRQPAGRPEHAVQHKVDERMNSVRLHQSNNLYDGDWGREYHAGVPAGGRSYVVTSGRGHWLQLHTWTNTLQL